LRKLTAPYGELENVFIVREPGDPPVGYRYGFAIYKTLEGAQSCVDNLRGVSVDGWELTVEQARHNPLHDRPEDEEVIVGPEIADAKFAEECKKNLKPFPKN